MRIALSERVSDAVPYDKTAAAARLRERRRRSRVRSGRRVDGVTAPGAQQRCPDSCNPRRAQQAAAGSRWRVVTARALAPGFTGAGAHVLSCVQRGGEAACRTA